MTKATTEFDQPLTKNDLSFLVAAMEKRSPVPRMLAAVGAEPADKNDKVKGEMSVPEPVTVNTNGTMTVEDYQKCSMVMAVCQNMVQKSLTNAAKNKNIEPDKALKNMNAWLQAYLDFPFPFFNFKDTQRKDFKKDDFSLDADAAVVESIVNIKNVTGLKDAVIGALKKSQGNLLSYSNTKQAFKYFGIITAYNETEIAVRVIKFAMNMEKTDVKTLCGSTGKTHLDSSYDTYQFVADKALMIKMQEKMGDKLIEYMADKLLEFVKTFYDQQLAAYQQGLEKALESS